MCQERWIFIDILINKKYSIDNLFDFPTILPREQTAEMNRLFDELFETPTIFANA